MRRSHSHVLLGIANLFLIREWGDDIDDEFETAVSLQARYRYSRAFEPALELYAGQDATGIGPVFLGSINIGTRKSLNWDGAWRQSSGDSTKF